MSLQSARSK